MLKIDIRNHQTKVTLDLKNIKVLCRFIVLNEINESSTFPKEISSHNFNFLITFLNRPAMLSLNKKTFNKSSTTDVISFSYINNDCIFFDDITIGEIFIFPGIAETMHKKFETSLNDEIMLYIIHGILHVFGYKDDTTANRKKMTRHEKFYMDIFTSAHNILKSK